MSAKPRTGAAGRPRSRSMRLTLAQTDVSSDSVTENVSRATTAIRDAAAEGADLVVLPELFSIGYFAFDRYAREAEGLNGETLSRFAASPRTTTWRCWPAASSRTSRPARQRVRRARG